MLSPDHIAAHVAIFLAYFAAVFLVPDAFRQLIYLRRRTIACGGGFFLLCANTHASLSFDYTDAVVAHVGDILQVAAIIGFLWFLADDLRRATARLQGAFTVIAQEFGNERTEEIARTVRDALQNKSVEPVDGSRTGS